MKLETQEEVKEQLWDMSDQVFGYRLFDTLTIQLYFQLKGVIK